MRNLACPFCGATAPETNAILFHGEISQIINGIKSTYPGYGIKCDMCLSVWCSGNTLSPMLTELNTTNARKAHTAAVFATISTTQGLETTTRKFTIQGVNGIYDIYFITGWCNNLLIFIDIYLGGMHEQNIRTLVELACKNARHLLESTQLTVAGLSRLWRRLEFEPKGFCAQLPHESIDGIGGVDGVVGGFVWSLLDAIAKYLATDMKKRGIIDDVGVEQEINIVKVERNSYVPEKN